jgi:hypothetical protein
MDLLPQVDFPPHASSQSFQLESDSGTLNADKEPSDSRSNSSLNLLDPPPATLVPASVGRPKRKDKGKAKEVENPPLRVKEEPRSFSLHTPDVPNPNNLVRQFFSVDVFFYLIYIISSSMRIIALLVVHTVLWFIVMVVPGRSIFGAWIHLWRALMMTEMPVGTVPRVWHAR